MEHGFIPSIRCYSSARHGQSWNGYRFSGQCQYSSESFKRSGFHLILLQHAGYDGDPIFNVTGFSQLHDDGTGGVSLMSSLSFPTSDSQHSMTVVYTTLQLQDISFPRMLNL